MRSLLAVSAIALLTACATGTDNTPRGPVTVDTPPPSVVVPDAFDLAMQTVDTLVEAGNEQTAIDRLTQLLGTPDLSDEDLAATLMKRAQLRHGTGHDLLGAISDLDELRSTYPRNAFEDEAIALRTAANDEAESLLAALTTGDLSPTDEFKAKFRLGQHQDATDVMLARSLKPENGYIVDMFQMGYLCDDDELTGPSYDMTEPDGTVRIVRFCEFGK